MESSDFALIRWNRQPRAIARSVVIRLNGVLVDASVTPAGDSSVRELPYAAAAIADLRHAKFAIIVLANHGVGLGSGDSRTGTPAMTTAALELLDPDRTLIDYAAVGAHGAAESTACLRRLEQEVGQSIEDGWVVGDQPADLDCGRDHGLRRALVATGSGVSTWDGLSARERSAIAIRSSIFAEAARHLLLSEHLTSHGATAASS
jgi:ribonucleotide monophosphatase NagD (HAD superfamily)